MKQTITPERLLGEYIGVLNGICAWDIPEQLREKLERRAKELQELQIEMEVQHKYKEPKLKSTLKFSHSSHVFDIVITSDFDNEKTFNHVIREMLFSKDMWMFVLSYSPSKTTKVEQSVEQLMATGEPLYPPTIKEPLFDAATHAWAVSAKSYYNSDEKSEDVFDITTMD